MVRPLGCHWSEHTMRFGSSTWNRAELHGIRRPPGSSYVGHWCSTGLPPATSLALHPLPTHPRLPHKPLGAQAPSVSQLNQVTRQSRAVFQQCSPPSRPPCVQFLPSICRLVSSLIPNATPLIDRSSWTSAGPCHFSSASTVAPLENLSWVLTKNCIYYQVRISVI